MRQRRADCLGKEEVMANKLYSIFSSDGTHKCNLSTPELDPQLLPDEEKGEVIIEGHYDNSVIYRDGKIIEKPESNIILTGTKLENLPNPTKVIITGNGAAFRETIEDGEFEFSIDVPGEYTVKCESRIELPIEFKVTIT